MAPKPKPPKERPVAAPKATPGPSKAQSVSDDQRRKGSLENLPSEDLNNLSISNSEKPVTVSDAAAAAGSLNLIPVSEDDLAEDAMDIDEERLLKSPPPHKRSWGSQMDLQEKLFD
jgi:hypothetical protein